MRNHRPFRAGSVSLLIDKRALAVTLSLFIFFLIVLIVSTGVGDLFIAPLDVLKSLFGAGSDMHNLVVRMFRLPRILLAAFAGMALAVAGAILQGIVRNPLASPDIIGITGGASLATVSFLALFSTADNALTVSIHWLPLASFLGALGTGVLVYGLSQKQGTSAMRLVLIGIGIAAGMQALTQFIMLLGPIYVASRATIWLTGSVHGASWDQVATLAVWFAAMFALTMVMARRLNVQELGPSVAISVGSSVNRDRNGLLILCTALAGGAVAFAGGIGFVGLMAPHMARRLVGAPYGGLIPVSALLGGLLVMLADLIGRTLFLPLEVPAGVFTSAIGAPYFIYLLYKSRNR
ncbi:MAG TPA: iron ABC transporter permease [Bacillales bacterium]|nr:iron ABC transporter permease [Bacillales bacterium]